MITETQHPDLDGPIVLLARVSDGGRAKLLAHVDTALLPHLGLPYVREIYRQVKADVQLLQRGAAGEAARAAAGFATVWAPGRECDLGVRVERGQAPYCS